MKRLLLLGAGHAHALVLEDLARKPAPSGASIALVCPGARQLYSGMVPGYLAGRYRIEDLTVDFAALASRAGVELVLGAVAALDANRSRIRLEDGRELAFDVASLNVGSLTDCSLPGAEHAIPVKPLRGFLERISKLEGRKLAVVGGGLAGAEIAMALAEAGFGVALYFDRPLDPALAEALRRSRVEARIGDPVAEIRPGGEVLTGSTRAGFDAVVLATGAAAVPWLRTSGLGVDDAGFVAVDETLRSASHPGIFAVGDCATLGGAALPRSGVQSVRQGPVLARNLRASLGESRRIERYSARRRSLMLVLCGDRRALAMWGAMRMRGRLPWRLKDFIDRRWIARFR